MQLLLYPLLLYFFFIEKKIPLIIRPQNWPTLCFWTLSYPLLLDLGINQVLCFWTFGLSTDLYVFVAVLRKHDKYRLMHYCKFARCKSEPKVQLLLYPFLLDFRIDCYLGIQFNGNLFSQKASLFDEGVDLIL